MHAPERCNRFGPPPAKSRLIRCIPLIAFSVLLSPTTSSAATASQEFWPGSVPLVPPILKSGLTIPEPCPPTISMEPKRYMIAWNDTPAIDGDFVLVVHPQQLFLRSSHNNPNPNYVYWVEQLSEGQYTQLVKFLDAYDERVFRRGWDPWPGYTLFRLRNPQISPQRGAAMTGESETAWELKSAAEVNSNLRRILRELNRGLSKDRSLRLDATINSYPNIVRIAE
jgi:hypothetical protein